MQKAAAQNKFQSLSYCPGTHGNSLINLRNSVEGRAGGQRLWASVRAWARGIIMTLIFIIITSVIVLREMISTSFVLDKKGRFQFICFQLQTSLKWQNLQGTIDILFTDDFPREWSTFVPSKKQLKSICATKYHLTSDQHTIPLGESPTNPIWCYGNKELSQIMSLFSTQGMFNKTIAIKISDILKLKQLTELLSEKRSNEKKMSLAVWFH